MKMINHKRIGFLILFIAVGLVMIIVGEQPSFSGPRQLPVINTAHVEAITMEYFMGETLRMDCSDQLEELVLWYNSCKELKTEVGTTSDCRLTIGLKDGREIYIWNLYSDEWVTVGYRDAEHYYQSNVYSKELAGYFNVFREGIQANLMVDTSGNY